jgi:inorganic triphosphatase YgiF
MPASPASNRTACESCEAPTAGYVLCPTCERAFRAAATTPFVVAPSTRELAVRVHRRLRRQLVTGTSDLTLGIREAAEAARAFADALEAVLHAQSLSTDLKPTVELVLSGAREWAQATDRLVCMTEAETGALHLLALAAVIVEPRQ